MFGLWSRVSGQLIEVFRVYSDAQVKPGMASFMALGSVELYTTPCSESATTTTTPNLIQCSTVILLEFLTIFHREPSVYILPWATRMMSPTLPRVNKSP